MIARLESAGRSRQRLMKMSVRPGCAPCDRSEAGYQLARLAATVAGLEQSLNILDYEREL